MKNLTIKEQIKTLESTMNVLNQHYQFTNDNDTPLKEKIKEASVTIEYLTRLLKSTGIK